MNTGDYVCSRVTLTLIITALLTDFSLLINKTHYLRFTESDIDMYTSWLLVFFARRAFFGNRYLHEKDVIFPHSPESWRRTQADELKRLRCANA